VVGLASGQQMTRKLRAHNLQVKTMSDEQILTGAGLGGADLSGLTQQEKTALLTATPLWFYILREAEVNAGRLAGVGARIVAEVFHRAMEGSRSSIVRDPYWRPSLGPDPDTFRMVDLLLFGAANSTDVLNPLGDAPPAPIPPAAPQT